MARGTFGLYQIWKDSFQEDDRYIDFFLQEGLPLGHLLTYGPAESPYASLSLFPISFVQNGTSYNGYYLYGLGTLLSKRGNGYGKLLVSKAETYTLETGRHFILLQPTSPTLFDYYSKLGYSDRVLRSHFWCTRTLLSTSACVQKLLNLSFPDTESHFSRFAWSGKMLGYINKECLFSGGAIIDHAYCYPNIDAGGPFVEIKEFSTNRKELMKLIPQLMAAFPDAERFLFFGKPQGKNAKIQQQSPFALVNFTNPVLKRNYSPESSYFALGLD